MSENKVPSGIDRIVGQRLRWRRRELKLTQEQLGEKLGLTFQQVQKYEKGVNRISAGRLFEMSKVLGITITYFYEGIDEMMGLSRRLLVHYGIDLDALLDSIEVETVENDGQRATVVTRFQFLGIPQEIRNEMVAHEGQWVSQDALNQAQVVSVLANMPRQSVVAEQDEEVKSLLETPPLIVRAA